MKNSETKLRRAIALNLVFSSTTAILLLVFSTRISEMMNLESPTILKVIGIGLIGFVGLLVYILIAKAPKKLVKSVIVQDWIWVVASVVILLFRPFDISISGNVIIALIAVAVVGLAVLQAKALKDKE